MKSLLLGLTLLISFSSYAECPRWSFQYDEMTSRTSFKDCTDEEKVDIRKTLNAKFKKFTRETNEGAYVSGLESLVARTLRNEARQLLIILDQNH